MAPRTKSSGVQIQNGNEGESITPQHLERARNDAPTFLGETKATQLQKMKSANKGVYLNNTQRIALSPIQNRSMQKFDRKSNGPGPGNENRGK